MRHRSVAATFVVTAAIAVGVLVTASARSPEPLFNGKDLTGWTVVNGKAPYTVVDGVIVGTTIADSPNSFLATDRTYRDFVLEFEVKQDVGPSNSGVQFRGQRRPDYRDGRVFGYQCEIDPSERAWTGGIYDEARREWLYQGNLNPAGQRAYKYGEWNRIRIEAIGTSLRTFVNDVPVAHVIDDVDAEGFIALQVHSIGKPEEAGRKVMFRNIRIQTTDLKPSPAAAMFVRNMLPNDLSEAEKAQGWRLLFDGKTTLGWRGALKTGFPDKGWQVKDGELSVQGSANEGQRGGDIVTTEEFGAFEFQSDFKLTPGANSGIKYYVTEKDGAALGLEYQLLDDEKHPDAKAGIGGNRTLASLYDILPSAKRVFNRNPAPRLADTWHHARIVAPGSKVVQHWLNGFKVLEYERGGADFKARIATSKFKQVEGFGLAAQGRILLQDHGDLVSFRSIKLRRVQ
jgi:hypothetical protein